MLAWVWLAYRGATELWIRKEHFSLGSDPEPPQNTGTLWADYTELEQTPTACCKNVDFFMLLSSRDREDADRDKWDIQDIFLF